jgi:Aminomethyltransferase folate-binding domain
MPATVAGKLWDELFERGAALGVVPARLGARDTLRLEMGYALDGNDISTETDPFEARLGWAVALGKPAFRGREVLLERKAAGPRSRVSRSRLPAHTRMGRLEAGTTERAAGEGARMRRAINLISEIDAFCAERFPDYFAGIAQVGPDLERPESVVVYRRPLAAFDAAVRGQFPQLSSILRFVDADHSRERLMALGRRVVEDAARSSGWGVTRSEISPAADGSAVEVVLADADGPTRALLSRRYGPPVVIAGGAATPTMPSEDMDAGEPLRHSHRLVGWRRMYVAIFLGAVLIVVSTSLLGDRVPTALIVLAALLVPLFLRRGGMFQERAPPWWPRGRGRR